ncbi:DNA replication/repair protein RecF [Colwellia asteriadis]|uniref:DNA replication and repair protein RecF n=1 Tax=Colwellia asteriadis TaxID=517723 RepID=A0ABP3WGV1_9GAMM
MSVAKLIVQNFRNLATKSISLHPELNFILGDNGSGKSSLLEAIFFIGHGKSFRTSKIEHLACYNEDVFTVSVKDNNDLQLGLSKDIRLGITNIKINGDRHTRLSDLASNIAVQIITPESFKLFFGGPKERRRFIDLGMFHVKQDFSHQWREFSRVLKQRNACIRSGTDKAILSYWSTVFCELSVKVAHVRQTYVESLIEELRVWLALLLPELVDLVNVQYLQGWPQAKELSEILDKNFEREKSYGYSLYGAHKFDVKFLLGKQVIDTQLSRGQQKLFLLALTFAQAKLISRVNRVKPILLIDDIGAELDVNSRLSLARAINHLDCQVIITAIEENVLAPFISLFEENSGSNKEDKYKMFHVKQGDVVEK